MFLFMKSPSPVDAGLLTITRVVGMNPCTWLLLYMVLRTLKAFLSLGFVYYPTLNPDAPDVLLPIFSSPLLTDALFLRPY